MHKELASPLASTAVSPWLRNAAIVVLGSALVAACSHVALPLWFTPVPLTMQPFAVLLLGLLLAPSLAAATLGAYLFEGALGLPVFAPGFGFGAGIAHLLGPTGGYLLSYPAAAALISYLWRRSSRGFQRSSRQRRVRQLRDSALRIPLDLCLCPHFGQSRVRSCRASLFARRRAQGCCRRRPRNRIPPHTTQQGITASNFTYSR